MNQVYEMDQFAGNLVKMMEERGEPTVVVFYGDHLPTMGAGSKGYEETVTCTIQIM